MKYLLAFAIFFSLSLVTFAQDTTPLVQYSGCTGLDCTACHVVGMANGIIKWLIGILFLLFAALMMIAGVRLVASAGNPGALSDAKDKFINAIIGFVIVLSAWLIVDTIMKGLVGQRNESGEVTQRGMLTSTGNASGWLVWSKVECQKVEKIDENKNIKTVDLSVGLPPPEVISTMRIEELEAFSHIISHESGVTGGVTTTGGSSANCPPATESEVVTIPGTSYKARPEIANAFVKMRDAAAADGITLQVTSGWRSDATQVSLYNRLCPGGRCGAVLAARPCSMGGNGSNHNSGRAIDIGVGCSNGQSGCNTQIFNWLKRNGGRFGFYNNLPTDPLHWSPSGR